MADAETNTSECAKNEKSKEFENENIELEMSANGATLNKSNKNNDDEQHGNSTSTSSPKKKKSAKKRKVKEGSPDSSRKKAKKDPNKPEYPKVGYVRFMYVRREELRKEFPDMHHLDVTKKIGEEWMTMDDEKKQPYLDAAKQDKIRYKMEMKEYNKNLETNGNTSAPTKTKKKKAKKSMTASDTSYEESPKKVLKSKSRSVPLPNGSPPDPQPSRLSNVTQNGTNKKSTVTKATASLVSITTPPLTPPQFDTASPIYGDIPIFTDQFLEHNRQMESELKKLRKHNTDYEQQNAVLEKHVENVRNGITKTETEIKELREENDKLNSYLTILREKLSHQLRNLSIPNEPNGANIENIDKYMNDLHEMAKTDLHGPASLNKAKDLLRKVDLNIDLNAFHNKSKSSQDLISTTIQ